MANSVGHLEHRHNMDALNSGNYARYGQYNALAQDRNVGLFSPTTSTSPIGTNEEWGDIGDFSPQTDLSFARTNVGADSFGTDVGEALQLPPEQSPPPSSSKREERDYDRDEDNTVVDYRSNDDIEDSVESSRPVLSEEIRRMAEMDDALEQGKMRNKRRAFMDNISDTDISGAHFVDDRRHSVDDSSYRRNVVPQSIEHSNSSHRYSNTSQQQNNASIERSTMFPNNRNGSIKNDPRIYIPKLQRNLQDFPLAAELYGNKRIGVEDATNAIYMKQLNDELQKSKTNLLADRTARKGDDRSTFRVAPKSAYRFEASTRPKSYKGYRVYTPPHASRPIYSDDPRKWGAGHNTHHDGDGIVLDAIGDAASLVYSNVGPLVNAGSWVNNKFSGGGRCHTNSRNCWGGRKIYPDSLSDFTTILGL